MLIMGEASEPRTSTVPPSLLPTDTLSVSDPPSLPADVQAGAAPIDGAVPRPLEPARLLPPPLLRDLRHVSEPVLLSRPA